MKLALCLPPLAGYDQAIEKGLANFDLVNLKTLDENARLQALKEADALFCHWLGEELTDQERGLLGDKKFVYTLSAGVETIRFHSLGKGTVLYSNVGAWASSMAESCLAMLYAHLRRFNDQKRVMKEGQYPRTWPLRTVGDVKCLVWGWGGIGKACAELLWKLGGHVSAVSRRKPDDSRLEAAYSMDDFDEAIKNCDILIMAVPANKTSVGMIDAKRLALMPKNGALINLARARLINRDDLYAHLKANPDFGAALDVWWKEDSAWDKDPLVELDNVIPSAHNSEMSDTIWLDALHTAMERINALARGEEIPGRVNYDDYC